MVRAGLTTAALADTLIGVFAIGAAVLFAVALAYALIALRLERRYGPRGPWRLLWAVTGLSVVIATVLWLGDRGEWHLPGYPPPFTPFGTWVNLLGAWSVLLILPSLLITWAVRGTAGQIRLADLIAVGVASLLLGAVLFLGVYVLPRGGGL